MINRACLLDAINSRNHKHKRRITFVTVGRYRFCGNAVEQATIPAVVPQLLSPLLRNYRSGRLQYCRKSAVTAVFPASLLSLQSGSAPAYLSSYFTRVADLPSRSRLRSSASEQLIVPSFNLATVGKPAFPVSAANLWNSLPTHLTSAPSLAIFRQRLKTLLFGAPIRN